MSEPAETKMARLMAETKAAREKCGISMNRIRHSLHCRGECAQDPQADLDDCPLLLLILEKTDG